MKSLLLFALLFSINASAAGSEQSRQIIFKGMVISEACAESNLAIASLKSKRVYCLGFNSHISERDLVPGQVYTLGGELTEDGFFPNEFLD